jgi:hypothetical protein
MYVYLKNGCMFISKMDVCLSQKLMYVYLKMDVCLSQNSSTPVSIQICMLKIHV